jgi:hypothetical protein
MRATVEEVRKCHPVCYEICHIARREGQTTTLQQVRAAANLKHGRIYFAVPYLRSHRQMPVMPQCDTKPLLRDRPSRLSHC